MHTQTHIIFRAMLVGALLTASAHAQSLYSSGHGDIGVEYTPGSTEFEAHWHLDSGAMVNGQPLASEQEFEPETLAAYVSTSAAVPTDSVAQALGVEIGADVFRTGTSAYPPNLGFGLEEIGDPTDWLNETVSISLTGFSGPGEMAVSQTISGIGTLVWFSSLGGELTQSDNVWDFGVGGHQHNNWWFSEEGEYEVSFTWTGTYIGGESPVEVSGTGTYLFQVQTIPESAAAGWLLGVGALALAWRRRAAR